jgi:hypothetical protein
VVVLIPHENNFKESDEIVSESDEIVSESDEIVSESGEIVSESDVQFLNPALFEYMKLCEDPVDVLFFYILLLAPFVGIILHLGG